MAERTLKRVVYATPLQRLVEPSFVIVGTGRSGTGYISTLLQEVGVRCGHERWWTLRNPNHRALRLHGDASWVATFQLDEYGGRIFHQIRDPLMVVNSFVNGSNNVLTDKTLVAHRMRARWVDFTGDKHLDALQVTVAWTREAERRAEWTWRVEDMNPTMLSELCSRVGRPIPMERAVEACASVASDTNRHTPPAGQRLRWEDLAESSWKHEAMDIARSYGYSAQ